MYVLAFKHVSIQTAYAVRCLLFNIVELIISVLSTQLWL